MIEVDGTIGLLLIISFSIIICWSYVILSLRSSYTVYSFKCLKCDMYQVTRSKIKIYFIENYHKIVCRGK